MHEGVLVFDHEAKAILANVRAIELTGIPWSELVNQRAADARFQPVLETISANAPGGCALGSARKRARPAIAGVLGRSSIS